MTDPTSLRESLDRLSAAIDGHYAWFARWSRAVLFPATAHKADPPSGLLEWARGPDRHPLTAQPAVDSVVALHDDLHARALALVLRAATGRPPSEAEYAEVAERSAELIAQLRRLERALALGAYGVDALTGLRADGGLRDDLHAAARGFRMSGTSFCLAMAAVDRRDKIDERGGTGMFDRILSTVARVTERVLDGSGGAYRMDGGNLAVLLRGTRMDEAARMLERIRREVVATPIVLPNGNVLRVTMAFGLIAASPDLTPDEMTEGAETALAQAQTAGGNRVVKVRLAEGEEPAG
ncbi:MAG TPA: diguanylate cyclase [Azospirillaceae bacterium]|nr:diguanylate cyclase [Azospirillaceae bacterium]